MQLTIQEKIAAKQLRRTQLLATSLLLLAICGYIFSLLYQNRYHFLIYLKSFCEASMVGALADWFAVIALFRHPLGLPIPHTAILPKNQARLASQVGSFIEDNFLQPYVIANKIRLYQPSYLLSQWIDRGNNQAKLASFIAQLLKKILAQINPHALSRTLLHQAALKVKGDSLGHALALVLVFLKQQNYDEKCFNAIVYQIKKWLSDPLIRDKLEDSINLWVKQLATQKKINVWQKIAGLVKGYAVDLMDKWTAQKIIQWLRDYCDHILQDPHHFIRVSFLDKWESTIFSLETSAKWHAWLNDSATNLLQSSELIDLITYHWHQLQHWLDTDITSNNSLVNEQIELLIIALKKQLINPQQRRKCDIWIARLSKKLVHQYKSTAAAYIEIRVREWNNQALVHKLELSVGKDLQYIRINGTLVGGLVGLLISICSQWIN